MRCSDIPRYQSGYLDNELGAWRRRRMEAHLATCEHCRGELAVERQVWSLLGAAEGPRAPDVLAQLELRLIREQAPATTRRWWGALAYAAALLLVAIGGATGGVYAAWPRATEGSASHAELAWLIDDVPPDLAALAVSRSER